MSSSVIVRFCIIALHALSVGITMLAFTLMPSAVNFQSTQFTSASLRPNLLAQRQVPLPGASKTSKARKIHCSIATGVGFMHKWRWGQHHIQASKCSALTTNAMSIDYGGEPAPGFGPDSLASVGIVIGLGAAYLSFAAGKNRANSAGRAVVEAQERLAEAIAETSKETLDTSSSSAVKLRLRELAAAKERFQKDRRWRFGPFDIELNPAVDQQV
eukprot:TRINITY_DN53342_c0_g1_i1.p1 TRINITY_DN53342_c0_g1~~TRINITY_DN53342_c0_g1_i1.p1  ORF type:complete len:215 (-),score=33.83 TRINITY_DN53342_c0_g1_i1:36-680(-)